MANTKIDIDQAGAPSGGTTGQALIKSSNADYDYGWSAAGSGETVQKTYTAINGFSVGQVVTNALATDDNYGLSQADAPANAEMVGIISAASGTDFTIVTEGFMNLTGFGGNIAGAVAGNILFMDDLVPGGMTLIEPTGGTTVSKPIAQVVNASTFQIYVHNYRGQNNQTIPAGTMSYTNGDTTKNISDVSGVQTIPHGLPATPLKVKITAMYSSVGASVKNTSVSVYNGTTQSSTSIYGNAVGSAVTNTFALSQDATPAAVNQTGVITFDVTNIYITWVNTGGPANVSYILVWEAETQS